MVQYAWLVPALPLLAYIILLALGKKVQEAAAATISVVFTLIAFVLSFLILNDVVQNGVQPPFTYQWLNIAGHSITVGYEVTPLNAMMLVVVTFVSTLVLLFSKGYMHGDDRIGVFYQYLSLFIFSMLGLVISPNLLQVYMFWELVGLCSYLLVGFWYFKPEAAQAAKKAFIVTRIGDVGLFIGIVLLFLGTGSFDYDVIFKAVQAHHFAISWTSPETFITLTAILVFIGAIGKSAQFPLHVWLPDAMEGPTPVSALIHAATMVAAGVYLVARTFPLFAASPTAMDVVAYIGGITAILAALIGLTQRDIKRVVAYSTVSQLGYMMMALGVGSYVASVFHLMTHAFFKALLFLAAGSVIHAMDTQDLFKMGGLFKKMPITAITFLAGALALSGIPPFAGFWSKDDILLGAYRSGHMGLYYMGVVAAFCTAFYIFRVYFLTFTGEYKGGADKHPHEGSWVMTLPLVVLGILATVAGFLNSPLSDEAFAHFMQKTGAVGTTYEADYGLMGISAFVGLLGILLAAAMYWWKAIDPSKLAKSLRPLYALSYNKFYLDELYHTVIVIPVVWIGRILNFIDRWIIDGIVNVLGEGTYVAGIGLKYSQNGQVQTYGLVTVFGALIIIGISLLIQGGV
jgi:NADH-quinone oxidoreductase subunit L